MKFYFCVKENGDGTDIQTIAIQPIFRQGCGGGGTELLNYAKKCSAAIKQMSDARTEHEVVALRKELKKFMEENPNDQET